jgi:hypothetical protein
LFAAIAQAEAAALVKLIRKKCAVDHAPVLAQGNIFNKDFDTFFILVKVRA